MIENDGNDQRKAFCSFAQSLFPDVDQVAKNLKSHPLVGRALVFEQDIDKSIAAAF